MGKPTEKRWKLSPNHLPLGHEIPSFCRSVGADLQLPVFTMRFDPKNA
jgi:hypothetical protein